MIKHIAAVAVIVLSAGCASAGTGDTKYELKRISMGPRSDQYVLVPVYRSPQADQPYALTGETQDRNVKRANPQPTPLHPKGTHGQF